MIYGSAFVTAYLFLIIPSPVKKTVVCGFQTISCLLSFKEGNQRIASGACLFSPLWKEREVHKGIHPKHFRVSGIKISNFVDNVALMETAIKFSQSLRGQL